MCGIAGEINFKDGVKFKDYHGQMLNVLNNRGPDDQNIKKDDFAVLLHTRLAVIDPKNGRQPMSARKDGMDYTICYNGELYGTDEIRNALIKQGVTFETKTDTEVVLKSFITFGADCVKSFNGIYAFVIY